MTTLVTGATGHIGVNLVRELLREGRKVRAFSRDGGSRFDGLDVEVVHGDVRDADAVRKAAQGAKTVFHLAAHISIIKGEAQLVKECNIQGPRNVVRACLDEGVYFAPRGVLNVSTVLDDDAFAHTVAAFERAAVRVAEEVALTA